ncbi:MAG: polysaccharide biosynthesis C-terminal domain-containing protein [Lachnospiraceae bacterium]|nr:polysaccharide biosynthesis C-terminal domain-containing protein [Lachnospiraceae bacterium]
MKKLSEKKYSSAKRNARKDSFILVTGISVIGMLIFRLVMSKQIGDIGMACFGSTNEIYYVLAGTISFGLSEAAASLVRYRVRRDQYRSAQRVLGGAVCIAGVLGVVLGLGILFSAQLIAMKLLKFPIAGLSIAMMAPAVPFFLLTGVFRGYFQGNGSHIPAMHSLILQVIAVFAGGIAGAALYKDYGTKVSALLQNADYTSAYGAKGASIGLLAASIVCFLHGLILYVIFRRNIRNQLGREMSKNQDSRLYLLHMILGTGGIDALYWFLFHGVTLAGEIILFRFGGEAGTYAGQWGAYYAKTLALTGIVGEAVCMICLLSVRRIASLWDRDEYRTARERLGTLVHQCAVIVIPAAVLLAVLAENLLNVIFGGDNQQAAVWTQAGSTVVPLLVFSTIFMDILLKSKKTSYAAGIGGTAFVLHGGVMFLLVNSGMGIMALIIGSGVFYLVTAGAGFWIIMRGLQYRQEWIRTFAVTIVAAAIAGVAAMLLNKLFEPLLGPLLSMMICLIAAVAVYLLLLTITRAFKDEELDEMAGGFLFRRLAELLHIMR